MCLVSDHVITPPYSRRSFSDDPDILHPPIMSVRFSVPIDPVRSPKAARLRACIPELIVFVPRSKSGHLKTVERYGSYEACDVE